MFLKMDEDQNPFFKNQINAIIRTRYLLGEQEPNKSYSIEDVIDTLARAEKRSKFICGFVHLNQSPETIAYLKDYMVENKYLSVDNQNQISLTEKGRSRSNTRLPDKIEPYI